MSTWLPKPHPPQACIDYDPGDWPPHYAIRIDDGLLSYGSWFAWTRKGAERKARRKLAAYLRRRNGSASWTLTADQPEPEPEKRGGYASGTTPASRLRPPPKEAR